MKTPESRLALLAALLTVTLVGCSMSGTKSGGVSGSIRKSLDQAGFKDVSAGQDREKNVVTLSGIVGSEAEAAGRGYCKVDCTRRGRVESDGGRLARR